MVQEMYHDGMDGHLFSTLDKDDDYIDNMVKVIQDIYPVYGDLNVDAISLLDKIDDIFLYAHQNITRPQLDNLVKDIDLLVTPTNLPSAFDNLISPIENFRQMLFKCSGDGDKHATTTALLGALSSYPALHTKVVIAFAAFALNYAKVWLVAQLCHTESDANAIFAELPRIADTSNPKSEQLSKLMETMLDVIKSTVLLMEICSASTFNEIDGLSRATKHVFTKKKRETVEKAHIPKTVYWTIRGIVACTSQIMKIIGVSNEATPNYRVTNWRDWELQSLALKLTQIQTHLNIQLKECLGFISGSWQIPNRIRLRYDIEEGRFLKSFRDSMDEIREKEPFLDGSTKKRVSFGEVIRIWEDGTLLLLISDLNLDEKELGVLIQIYNESRHEPARFMSHKPLLWLPVLDKPSNLNEPQLNRFYKLRDLMPWYSFYHPSFLHPTINDYIKKKYWRPLNKIPQLVQINISHISWLDEFLDPKDVRMILILETGNFSFSSLEEDSWMQETWSLHLLTGLILTPLLLDWVSEGKHICLYGGEDIEWIEKFTTTAKVVAKAAEIKLEMLYVGKSDYCMKVIENNTTIRSRNLSHILQDPNQIRLFWLRLQRIWLSKVKNGKRMENDRAMREIATILSFDGSNRGWAVIDKELFRGDEPSQIVKAKSDTILKSLSQYDEWKDHVAKKGGFLAALNENLREQQTPHLCNRMIFPETENIYRMVFCPECDRPMQKHFVYRCCN